MREKIMKIINLALLSILISACSMNYNPRYYYHNIEVANLTGDTIRNLRVQVGPEGRVLECEEVTKNRICTERFGKKPYPRDVVEVSWTGADGQAVVEQVNPQIPLTFVPSHAVRLMLDIGEGNTVEAYFRQETIYQD